MKSLVSKLLHWLLGGVLLLAGLSKLPDPQVFLSSLAGYELPLPAPMLPWLAATLPWLELLCAFLLLFGVWQAAVKLMTVGLLASLTCVTALAWARGLQIDCGCFNLDFLEPLLGRSTLTALATPAGATVRNVVLTAAAVVLWRWSKMGEALPATLLNSAHLTRTESE